MWHINIYNKTLYDKTGQYLCMTLKPPFPLEYPFPEIQANYSRDLAIASYDLPFSLSGMGWEVLEKISDNFILMQRLEEIEDTVFGIKFRELRNYYFDGNTIDYLKNYKYINTLPARDYLGAAQELIHLGYLGREFVLEFFDFERFVQVESDGILREMHLEDVDAFFSRGINFLEILATKIAFGYYTDYLKYEQLQIYLKNQFRLLETEVGFFVDARKANAYNHAQFGRFDELTKRLEVIKKLIKKDELLEAQVS